MEIERVKRVIAEAFPQRRLASLTDRGTWDPTPQAPWHGAHVIYFTLDDNSRYCLKSPTSDTAEDTVKSDLQTIALLRQHGLPAPRVILAETGDNPLGAPFYVMEHLAGTKLCTLWLQVCEDEKRALFFALGQLLARMHAIHNTRSGLISGDDPYRVKYPDTMPNDFMFQAELQGGSGKRALERGFLSPGNHAAVLNAWQRHMPYLKAHQPSLIHFSTFCWTVSFLRHDGQWTVSRMTALSDVLWWDPACNLALVRYPPFMHISQADWESFLQGYGHTVDEKRVALYGLLTTISAAMGTYLEPGYLTNPYVRDDLNRNVEALLDRVESHA